MPCAIIKCCGPYDVPRVPPVDEASPFSDLFFDADDTAPVGAGLGGVATEEERVGSHHSPARYSNNI